MKTATWIHLGALSTGLLIPLAHAEGTGWYVRGDLGVSVVQDSTLEAFLDPVLGSPGGGEVSFDPGMRLGFAGGYAFLPWLAVELESGFIYNSVDNLGGYGNTDAGLLQVPILVNLVARCDELGAFHPMVGIGAGGISDSLMLDGTFVYGENLVSLEGSDNDVVFAYQAFAGFALDLSESWRLTAFYRYLASEAPSWEVDEGSFFDLGTIEFDRLTTHSVSVGVQYNF